MPGGDKGPHVKDVGQEPAESGSGRARGPPHRPGWRGRGQDEGGTKPAASGFSPEI